MVTLETTGGPDGRSTDRAMQAFDRAVVALVATCAVYTLWRGATLQVEYYDGYRYLANASRLLGEDVSFDQIRPPLLTLLLVPVVALGRLGGPANAALVFGPHLFSAVLSLCTAAVVFDNSSLPEVAGAAGITVPDGDAGAMAAAIVRLLHEPAERVRRSDQRRAWASQFTWRRAAEATLTVYDRVLPPVQRRPV